MLDELSLQDVTEKIEDLNFEFIEDALLDLSARAREIYLLIEAKGEVLRRNKALPELEASRQEELSRVQGAREKLRLRLKPLDCAFARRLGFAELWSESDHAGGKNNG